MISHRAMSVKVSVKDELGMAQTATIFAGDDLQQYHQFTACNRIWQVLVWQLCERG